MKINYPGALLAALLLGMQNAQAEHRLFPTDILGEGEADIQLGVARSHNSNSFRFARGASGVWKRDQTSDDLSLRYGLGENWRLGVVFRDNPVSNGHANYDNGPSYLDTSNQGQQNPSLWAGYAFVKDGDSPFSLSGELAVRVNTTGKGSGSETASLTGGWDFGDGLKGYATYSEWFPHDHKAPRGHTIAAGAFKTVTDKVTLIPGIHYSRYEGSDQETATQQYGAGLAALVQIEHSTYLRPSVSVYRNTPHGTNDGVSHWGDIHGRTLAVSLYHLF